MDNTPLVELHVHLEGAVKHETLYELLKKDNLPIPGNSSLEDMKRHMIIKEPKDLSHFLMPFCHIVPVIKNLKVAERVAYEFCEELSKNNVKYAEARYAPHNFVPDQREVSNMTALEEAIKAITRGFTRGELEFGTKVRSILSGLNGDEGFSDILPLSRTFKNEGVVGIDTAAKQGEVITEEIILDPKTIYVYEEAKKSGIHRTVHAGESGGPDMVERAVDVFHAERVGHGYHVLDDNKIYKRMISENIHFECCPWSSLLSGSIPATVKKHPIVRFAEDNVNFSINSDDPVVTGRWISDDFELAKSWGIPTSSLKQASINAAENSFLPEQEKKELIKIIKKL